ncbi:MAG: glycosyl hydrolase family 65 protein [bacterium]
MLNISQDTNLNDLNSIERQLSSLSFGIKSLLSPTEIKELNKKNTSLIENPDMVFYDVTNIKPVPENKDKIAALSSVLSIENGYFGARSDLEEGYKATSTAGTYVAGMYIVNPDNKQTDKLAVMPDWTKMQVFVDGKDINISEQKIISHIRYFDTKKGVTVRELEVQDDKGQITKIKTEKFASLKDRNIGGKSISVTLVNYKGKISVKSGIDASVVLAKDNVPNAKISPQILNKTVTVSVQTPQQQFKDGNGKENGIIEHSKQLSVSQRSTFSSDDDSISVEQKSSSKQYNKEDKTVYENWTFDAKQGKEYKIDSLVAIHSSVDDKNPNENINTKVKDPSEKSITHLDSMSDDFYAQNYKAHVSKMNERMEECGINICGDSKSQRYANYANARLVMAAENNDEYHSVSARTLTGPNYAGHVFWDNEIFDLPHTILTNPEKAKDMLMYRYHTLAGARKNTEIENKREGTHYKGARYAWESSSNGEERTPPWVFNEDGKKVKIMSAVAERHIVPDVACAVYDYWKATGDDEFMKSHGAEIMFETARYSRSILVEENDGKLHTKNVVGPDEYHEQFAIKSNGEKEGVHDNAYTNIFIKHNLDKAREVAFFLKEKYPADYKTVSNKIKLQDSELQDWDEAKEKIYVSKNYKNLVIEQFKGFNDLPPVDLKYFREKYGEEPAQKFDVVIKKENREKNILDEHGEPLDANAYQGVKQSDVLMIASALPDRLREIFPCIDVQKIIQANYDYYEPKTSHGSSLSVGIHSQIASRLGKKEEAYKYFIQSGGMDIDDVMNNAKGGIHAATLGATWIALIKGFGGLDLKENGLAFAPTLPNRWNRLAYNVKWHGQKLNVTITKNITNDQKVQFKVGIDNKTSIPVSISKDTLGEDKFRNLEAGKIYSAEKTSTGWKWIDAGKKINSQSHQNLETQLV